LSGVGFREEEDGDRVSGGAGRGIKEEDSSRAGEGAAVVAGLEEAAY
jgi:hypothetical protein